MASLSQASRLEDLPSSHDAFQGHATHIIEWSMMLRPKDSEGTCIPIRCYHIPPSCFTAQPTCRTTHCNNLCPLGSSVAGFSTLCTPWPANAGARQMRRSSRTCLARVSRPGQRLDRGGVLLYHATCSMMARGAAPRLLVLERRLRLREGSASGVPEGTGEVGRLEGGPQPP